MTDDPHLVPAAASALALAECYDAVQVFRYGRVVSADTELTRTVAEYEARLGYRPTVVFDAIAESRLPALANPYPRAVLLSALGVSESTYLRTLYRRLNTRTAGEAVDRQAAAPAARQSGRLADLPPVRHRPRDVGPYLTAGVLVCRSPDGRHVNLGIYRAFISGSTELRLFLDSTTDAHRIMGQWHDAGCDMPVAIFMAADPAYALVAAGSLAATESQPGAGTDDYTMVAKFLRREVIRSGEPPVPASAPFVLRGRLTSRLATEGPFGEFKGYYTEQDACHVVEVDSVETSQVPVPFIVPGAESGVALSGLAAELRLYAELTGQGYAIESVRYPVNGYGKYAVRIETSEPSRELIDAVMRADRASKLVLCGYRLGHRPWNELSCRTTIAQIYPFMRRGRQDGHRVGILMHDAPDGERVEF